MDELTYPYRSWRAEFPILSREVHGHPLVYLDNAATTQKPQCVIDCISEVYTRFNANIHRGVHALSQESTLAYESARRAVARFLGAREARHVIFTHGTTASLNLLASTLGESRLSAGDRVLVSELEHHSNLVPWQLLARRRGVVVEAIPISSDGVLDLEVLEAQLRQGARLVCVAHVSNALGVVNPVEEIARLAHAHGALLVVDGAQGVKHGALDVEALGADFYAFSGHKLYGPNGVGILWGRADLLESLPPWQGGGEMVGTVSFEGTTFAELPFRLEAGTPPYVEAIGLGRAVEFYTALGPEKATGYESMLLARAYAGLETIPGIQIYGYHPGNAAILSFGLRGGHPYDLGILLDRQGVAVRTGTHCAEPLMRRLGITGTVRAAFAFYNTPEEVDIFIRAVERAVAMLS